MATAVPMRMLDSAEGPVPAAMTEAEYLRTVFHPDCEFVEGQIEVRNVGEFEHSRVQLMLAHLFRMRERDWAVVSVTECRLQVEERHYRIPDVMVLRRGPKYSGIIHDAPLLCIEVLSPEDTWTRMRVRLDEYLAMGVENVVLRSGGARSTAIYGDGI